MKDPNVAGEDTMKGILEKIRTGFTKQNVEAARQAGKNSQEYQRLKESTMCWTANATFSNTRKRVNIQTLTGFIYLDVDDSIDATQINDTSFVYASWLSFSGTGLGFLAKVDNLSLQNYDAVWTYIYNYFGEIGIDIDKQTKDVTRQNVISYDPYLYKNPNCTALDANSISTTTSENYYVSTNTGMTPFSAHNGTDIIKYRTVLENYEGENYLIIKSGKPYRNCFMPQQVNEGQRHKWLISWAISLLYNNPSIDRNRFYCEVNSVNKKHMNPPLGWQEANALIYYLYDCKCSGRINYNPKSKKIWFPPDSPLTLKEKRSIVGKESGKLRRESAIEKIQETYDTLKLEFPKVTQKMVSEKSAYSISTIKNYWKDIIK